MPENLLLLNRYDFRNENFTEYFSHQGATFDTNFEFEWTLPLMCIIGMFTICLCTLCSISFTATNPNQFVSEWM